MIKLNMKYVSILMLLVAVILLIPDDAFAAFESLKKAGRSIFGGLRSIIYPASAVGIIAVCIGGFFGNINWKWLTAVVIGLIVIACCQGFIEIFAPDAAKEVPANVMSGS